MQEFRDLVLEITKEMNQYKFYIVGEKIYAYIWHTFADKIIEESKINLQKNDKKIWVTQYLLKYILENSLKILHPFMPFVTEEIWSMLPGEDKQLLIVTSWPSATPQASQSK